MYLLILNGKHSNKSLVCDAPRWRASRPTARTLYAINMDDIKNFLSQLKKYESGDCSLGEVRLSFESLDRFHDFWHFIADEDIREKDPEYSKMQNNELKKFITAIEKGEYEAAQNITFLGESNV